MMQSGEKNKGPDFKALGWFGVVWAAVGAIVGGGLLGWALDGWLGTLPVFMIAGFVIGVAAAFWYVYKMVMKSIEDE